MIFFIIGIIVLIFGGPIAFLVYLGILFLLDMVL